MRVVEILASVGDEVKESDPLVLVEKARVTELIRPTSSFIYYGYTFVHLFARRGARALVASPRFL